MRLLSLLAVLLLGCSAPEFKSLPAGQDASTADAPGVQDGAFPDALADVADSAAQDAAPPCNTILPFTATLAADTFLDANDPTPGASKNYGAAPWLSVASLRTGTAPRKPFVPLLRFGLTPAVRTAIQTGQLLTLTLNVTTADAGGTSVAGAAQVYFMRTDWGEGTGSYDGANWAEREATCAGCDGGTTNDCCDYVLPGWDAAGATGAGDRAANVAAQVQLPEAFESVMISLNTTGLGAFAEEEIGVQIVGLEDDNTYLWLAAKGQPGAATLSITYCKAP